MKYPVFPYTQREAERAGISNRAERNRNCLFARRLAQLRAEKKLSQQKLADLLEVSKSTISLYETGDTVPDAKMIVRMCEIFGVSCDYFLCQSDYRAAEEKKQTIGEIGLSELTGQRLNDLDLFTMEDVYEHIQLPFSPKGTFNRLCEDARFVAMMRLLTDSYQMRIAAARNVEREPLQITNMEVIGCRQILAALGEVGVPMDDLAEVYLQRASELLKEIARAFPTEDPETGEKYRIQGQGNMFSPLRRGKRKDFSCPGETSPQAESSEEQAL